jgi:hypothetical protein
MQIKVDIRVSAGLPVVETAEFIAGYTESGVEQVFIFPTHTQDGGYEMPAKEVAAFKNVIFPGLTA